MVKSVEELARVMYDAGPGEWIRTSNDTMRRGWDNLSGAARLRYSEQARAVLSALGIKPEQIKRGLDVGKAVEALRAAWAFNGTGLKNANIVSALRALGEELKAKESG